MLNEKKQILYTVYWKANAIKGSGEYCLKLVFEIYLYVQVNIDLEPKIRTGTFFLLVLEIFQEYRSLLVYINFKIFS